MQKDNNSVQGADAKAALDSLAKIERSTNRLIRPPIWLNVIMSGMYGMMTFSWASTRHENEWALGLIASGITFFVALAFYLYTARLMGSKPKLTPRDKPEWIFQVVMALAFGGIFILSRHFSVEGITSASYIGGVLNAVLLGYSLHNFSTGKFVKEEKSNE